MAFVKFLPIVVGIILAGVIAASAQVSVPPPSQSSVTLRVGYPDSLDESDITDMYAYTQILAGEGIHVIPTFYDSPPLSYKGLLAGQQDISFGTTAQAIARGPGGSPPQQTTCVTSYALAGVFLEVAAGGITSPAQMKGLTAEDFGPGTSTRSLDLYWYAQAGIPTTTSGVTTGIVNLKTGGGNIARFTDITSGTVQAAAFDDFILPDFANPAINNSNPPNHGPYHVLFYAPNNYFDNCFSVMDSWLNVPANQQVLVKFISAIIQAQRFFISNPSALVTFAESQLPLTAPSEIQFVSTFYPGHFTYWPFGAYNLMGNMSLSTKFNNTSTFFIDGGVISTPVSNSTVTPFGVVNKWFEYQALVSLGPFRYPTQSWVTPTFKALIQAWVPTSIGSS